MLKVYLKRLNLSPEKVEKIVHGECLSAQVYKLHITNEGNTIIYVLKILYDENRLKRELFFLNELKNFLPLPKVIDYLLPEDGLNGCILLSYIPGEIVSGADVNRKKLYNMGVMLAKLHLIETCYYGDIATKQFYSPNEKNIKYMLKDYFNRSIEECKEVFDYNLISRLKHYFEKNLSIINHFDGPHITHRDFKPGNMIFSGDEINGIIDWEICKYSCAEEDIAQMEFLVFISRPEMRSYFYDGYATYRKVPEMKKIDFYVFLKFLGSLGFFIRRKTYLSIHSTFYNNNMSYLLDLLEKE